MYAPEITYIQRISMRSDLIINKMIYNLIPKTLFKYGTYYIIKKSKFHNYLTVKNSMIYLIIPYF